MNRTFRGYLVEKHGERCGASVRQFTSDQLPAGEVTIRVGWSSLNYKDALAATGHPGVARKLPHIPGIDAAGIVAESTSPKCAPGDSVLVTGYELGQSHWGGWADTIRVPADWIVPLPKGLSAREAMIYGTAGFTAAQCVHALQRNGVEPARGEVVVTGATGGVGSLAVRLLAKLGYPVVAVSGKVQHYDQLRSWGASRVIGREDVLDESKRPMLKGHWAGGVDTIGGATLVTLLRSTQYGACIAACGLVGGTELEMSVYPFLLRGVTLCGIASADCTYDARTEIWRRLSAEWKLDNLESQVSEITLDDLTENVQRILKGEMVGRVLVRVDPS